MPLLPALLIAVAAIVLTAAAVWFIARTGRLAHRLRTAAALHDKMHDAARRLVKDVEVGDIVTAFVVYWAEAASHGSLARRVARDILLGRMDSQKEHSRSGRELKAAMTQLSPQQHADLMMVVGCGLMSSALSGVVLGERVARIIASFLSETGKPDESVAPKRAETAAVDAIGSWQPTPEYCPA